MIKKSITFVVGAGASRMYGLPIGSELKKKACDLRGDSDVYSFTKSALVLRDPAIASKLGDFLEDLSGYPEDSIDAFLEKRRGEPDATIGRFVIAALMGDAFSKASSRSSTSSSHVSSRLSEDWLLHVMKKLIAGADTFLDFANNNERLRFVTFNFDTYIEERMQCIVDQTYAKQDTSRLRTLCPVIHVHGKVTSAPTERMTFDRLGIRSTKGTQKNKGRSI